MRVPTGLAYHLSDIYLEELDKALLNPPTSSHLPAPLATLLTPFFALASRTPKNTTYQRVQSSLFEPLLRALKPSHSEDPPSSKRPKLDMPTYTTLVSNSCVSDPREEGPTGAIKLRKALLKHLLEVASNDGTGDSNRRKMYLFWKNHAEDEDDNDRES